MKTWLTIKEVPHADDPALLVWHWEIEDANGHVAGGYCSTEADARNDAAVWEREHS